MGYNWEKIFIEKEDSELVKIYSGDSHLDFEASIYAGLELINRGFDFNKIRKIHNQKTQQIKMEIENYKKLKFVYSKYFRNQVFGGIGIIGLIYILIKNPIIIDTENNYELVNILIIIGISLASVFTAKWNFNRFKKSKEKNIEKKINLLKRITLPDRGV